MRCADARAFFDALYSGVGAGFLEVRPLLDSADPLKGTEQGAKVEARARRWFPWPKGLDACVEHCTSLGGRGLHVYFGVALRKRDGGGTKKDVGCATAIFADVDFKDVPKDRTQEILRSFQFQPSACVRSGDGVHVYWFLREPVFESRFQELERVNRAVLVAFGAQVGPQNVDRLLRVPDTANIKPKYPDPKPVAQVSWWRPGFRYSLEEFSAAFPEPRTEPEPILVRHAAPHPRPDLSAAEISDDRLLGMARLLSEVWVVGFRHYLALHIGGLCAHAGMDEASALRLMEAVCDQSSDEEVRDRLEAVASSYRKFAAGDRVAGFTALLGFVSQSFPPALLGRALVVLESLRGSVLGACGRAPTLVVSGSEGDQ